MRKILLNILAFWVITLSYYPVILFAAEQQVDVRILVDVSGSMKHNDPKHLRRPAVRLLSGILPAGSKAGIWMFAEDTQNLVPVAKVNSAWKRKVRRLAGKIHDRGLYTDIGDALETASADWEGANNSQQRVMVLLTDGVVDISKDEEKNKAERLRIQNEVIPALRKLGVRVYTIALSDDADRELLAQIANATDAWFEAVKNADELEKVFLKIFEQSVSVPEVPLTQNKFKIDHSIKEFTALIFKKNDDAIYLQSPSGQKFEAETMDASIAWFSEENFDLITITEPEAGEWKIIGPVDPDNRIMVVSDLKLDVNNDELPTSILAGDELILKVSLQEKNKIIKKSTFLSLVNFVGQITSTTIDEELDLQDGGEVGDEVKEDGVFSYLFKAPKIDNEVAFDLRVVSPTFERLYHRSVRVYSSYFSYQTKVAANEKENHQITVNPVSTLVDSKSLKITGVLKNPDGSEIELEFTRLDNGSWQTKIAADNVGGRYEATLQIKGKTLSGKAFSIKDHKINFDVETSANADKAEKKKINNSETKTAVVTEAEEATEKPEQPEKAVDDKKLAEKDDTKSAETAAADESAGLSTLWWIIIGVVFNIIFFGGGFFAWKRWKKKQSADGDALANALDDELEPQKESTVKETGKTKESSDE